MDIQAQKIGFAKRVLDKDDESIIDAVNAILKKLIWKEIGIVGSSKI